MTKGMSRINVTIVKVRRTDLRLRQKRELTDNDRFQEYPTQPLQVYPWHLTRGLMAVSVGEYGVE
jgi:hypothetical protein